MAKKETTDDKALRYLAEGRVTVTSVDSVQVEATARGTAETYEVTNYGQGWTCSCPAHTTCCHIIALRLICESPSVENLMQYEPTDIDALLDG